MWRYCRCSPDVQWLVDTLDASALHMDNVEAKNLGLVFYVAGFIGKGISRANKCASCKVLLLGDKDIVFDREEHEHRDAAARQLLELADRGGLTVPTEFTLLYVRGLFKKYPTFLYKAHNTMNFANFI